MKRNSKIPISLWLLAFAVLFTAGTVNAQRSDEEQRQRQDQQVTRQAQAVSQKVYDKIQQAQKMIDADEFPAALHSLIGLNRDELTEYEQSKVLQYIGFIQHSTGNTDAAIEAYMELLQIPTLEIETRKQTIYILGQLNTAAERYSNAIDLLEEWFTLELNPPPAAYILYAQILYQSSRFSEMIRPIETAIDMARAHEMPIEENWYVLLSFAHFQQENYGDVRDIHKLLLAKWPKKSYWISLAGTYTELGDQDNLFAAYDAVHTQKLLESEAELVTMAQLYMQHEVPYKAGMLLESEMENGRVSRNANNYRLLSQAWSLAQEDERSIPALREAANLSSDGELDLRLGNAYLNLGQYAACVSAIQSGLSKGGIKNPGDAQISLGMSHYYQQHYDQAAIAFRKARKTDRLARHVDQWLDVIDRDIERDEQIALAEAATQDKIRQLANRRETSRRD